MVTDGDVPHAEPPFILRVEPLGEGGALLLCRATQPPRLLSSKVLMIGCDENTSAATREWIDLHTVERLIAYLFFSVYAQKRKR